MEYTEDDFLALSGLQHFAFCRRQWALIHIEQQWAENLRTVEGALLHEKAHDGYSAESRGDVIVSRGMPVFSRTLGLRGVCDIVELRRSPQGVPIAGRDGLFLPVPVEYKRGRPKEGEEDVLQLAAQAMCLAEMLVCDVPAGFLFYGETRRRVRVEIDDVLRAKVTAAAAEMHALFDRRHTPKVKTGSFCRACSLANLCLPKLNRGKSAVRYIQSCREEPME